MTRAALLVSVVAAGLLIPLACGEDQQTTSGSGSAGDPTTGSAMTGGGGSTGAMMTGGGGDSAGGMGAGASNPGGSSDLGGADGSNCEDCADNVEDGAGQMQFEACFPPMGTDDCESWWDCYTDDCMNGQNGGQFDAACFMNCDTMFANEANLYGPMKACICSECPNSCLPFCP